MGKRRRTPLWARLCVIAGSVLMLLSATTVTGEVVLADRVNGAVHQQDLLGDGGDGGTKHGSDIKGPIDMLLTGSDLRSSWKQSGEKPRTDTIMWLHIPTSMDRAYLLSIPRDLIINIPVSKHSGGGGETAKINGSFSDGMTSVNDVAGGMQLLTKAVEQVTGAKFTMAALVNWDGFKAIVAELGGVELCVDKGFTTDQIGKTYTFKAGCRNYDADDALALVRMRYNYADSDYGRQRMQQQFIKQILKKATSAGVVTNPAKLNRVISAAGGALTTDLNGYKPVDLALALQRITPDSIVGLQVPHYSIGSGDAYQGEGLTLPLADQEFKALRDDNVDSFIIKHPDLVSHGDGTG